MGKSTISVGDHRFTMASEVDFEFYRFSLSEGTLELDDLYLGRWEKRTLVVTKGYQGKIIETDFII